MNGFTLEVGISAFTVWMQGVLSFFSPCVLPLVPLYIGYLAGGTKTVDADGNIHYKRSKVMINTLFFVLGVSFAFFLLGLGVTAAGRFFSGNRAMFARIGGILVILFGLYQLGFFGSRLLGKEHRLPFNLSSLAMNPLAAAVLGFTFSFAWTPCVGPALASVLLMASSAGSSAGGFLLIGVYTLGFVLPFLAVGLFTGTVLEFFKRHQQVVRYSVKVGGALMIFMGVMMFTGWMNGITGYLSNLTNRTPSDVVADRDPSQGAGGGQSGAKEEQMAAKDAHEKVTTAASGVEAKDGVRESSQGDARGEQEVIAAPDFTLTDQYGNEHKLSDYKGKTVFLNFWATWCPPCRQEMPDIQKLYEEYGENQEDLVILGAANPNSDGNAYNREGTVEDVKKFLDKNGYTYPVVMDTTGDTFTDYYVTAVPTTFMIDKEGNVFGYVTGALTEDIMRSIIAQTMEGKRSR